MSQVIKEILTKYSAERENLLSVFHEIQHTFGYLSVESIIEIGKHFHLPTSKVYGVASYYNNFRFEPLGKYNIQVCQGTTCHLEGMKSVLQEIENQLKIKAGNTTQDSLFSLSTVACMGACAHSPVMAVNNEVYTHLTSEKILEIIDYYRKKEE